MSPNPPSTLSSRGALLAAVVLCASAAFASSAAVVAAQSAEDLRGAWAAQQYHMSEGGVHPVEGRIFFTERDWQVLFFVMDGEGEARRGSGEGGTYTVEDGRLVFTHLFNLSAGDEMTGLPASELRMVTRSPEDAPTEPTRIDVVGDALTLHFPSGNRLTFRRSS